MNQLNSIILEGNVVSQAEMREPSKGFKVCNFPLAVNRFSKNPVNGEAVEEVSFFDVETYGKLAEVCEKQSTKGRGIRVVGRLRQNRWTDSSGKKFSKIIVVAEHLEYKPVFKPETEKTENEELKDTVKKQTAPETEAAVENVF